MKVILVTEEGRFGGPQRWLELIVGRLKEKGVFSTMVIPRQDSECFSARLKEQGVDVFFLSLHRLTKHFAHLLKFILFFIPETFALYRFFRSTDVRIVHCNNSWQFKGVIAAKLAGKTVIWHLHESGTPRLVNVVFRFLARRCVDAFIVAGQCVKSYYLSDEKLTGRPVAEIQSPVDTAVFDPEHVEADQKICGRPGLNIVTVGNINPAKGMEYFIEMAAILKERHDNLNFFIVGPHMESQKKYVQHLLDMVRDKHLDNVHFYGACENIGAVLKAADIYVCSSVTEASPLSVWEAMSMERPIVATDVGDIAQFIVDGANGFIVPSEEPASLAEKVTALIDDQDLRKKLGKEARKTAVERLDVALCVEKHAQFYRRLDENIKLA